MRSAADHEAAEHTSALSIPGVRVLAMAFLGIGAVFGGMQVSLTAFAEEIGNPGINGVLYGIFAAGNMLAGIACGAIAWKSAPRTRLIAGYTALALAALRPVGGALRAAARRPRPDRRSVHRPGPDHRLHAGRDAGPGDLPHRGVHLADRRGRRWARPPPSPSPDG